MSVFLATAARRARIAAMFIVVAATVPRIMRAQQPSQVVAATHAERVNVAWLPDLAAQRVMRADALQASVGAQMVAEAANWWGGDGVIILAALLWIGGRMTGRRELARVGWRGAEGLAVASALSAVGKGLFGRARPFVTPGEPWNFEFSRGWTEAQFFSMPSGHTTATAAFAVGAILATRSWPPGRRAAFGIPLVVSAVLVGLGRMYANQHWLTDVIVAMTLGAVVGALLARMHRRIGDGAYARAMLGAGARRGALAVGLMASVGATGVAAQTDSTRHGAPVTWRDAGVLGAATAGSVYGDPGVLIVGAGLWGAGHLLKRRGAERVGLRSLEAIVASGVVAGALKAVAGRGRPDQSPSNARDFAFARGLSDGNEYQSFPSGHVTSAFAFAAAVDGEWARLAPQRPRWVRPVLYGMAVVTAASRVYDDRHWTSDVLMGGAIGFVTGRAVVRWHADQR